MPAGLLTLVGSILGIGNIEIITILAVFGASHTSLLLTGGCTRIAKISDSGSALAIPVIILFTAWISKVIFASIMRF